MYILSFQLEQEERTPRIWCNHRLPPTQPKRTSPHIQTPLRTLQAKASPVPQVRHGSETDICFCDTEPMTVDHSLAARCPHWANLWEEIWPNGTCIQDQLYGETDQLPRAANFISIRMPGVCMSEGRSRRRRRSWSQLFVPVLIHVTPSVPVAPWLTEIDWVVLSN